MEKNFASKIYSQKRHSMENRDGNQFLFWLHNWCSQDNLLNMLGLSHDQVDSSTLLSQFILPNRSWDLQKLKTLLLEYIINTIKGIRIPFQPLPDEPIWGPLSLGEFTIKSANWLSIKSPSTKKNDNIVGFGK